MSVNKKCIKTRPTLNGNSFGISKIIFLLPPNLSALNYVILKCRWTRNPEGECFGAMRRLLVSGKGIFCTVLRTRVSLGPSFGGILGRFFGPISTIFGISFSSIRKSRFQWGFRLRIKLKKLLKIASIIEGLKTRLRSRFAYQKMDCSRGKGLENHPKMAQNWDPNSHAFSIRWFFESLFPMFFLFRIFSTNNKFFFLFRIFSTGRKINCSLSF